MQLRLCSNKDSHKHFRATLGVIALCLPAALPAGSQQAQPPSSLAAKTVTLNLHKRPFIEFSKTLAMQLGRGILVDGEPFPKEGDVEFTGSGSDALDKVAAAFDCDWSEGKHGVILMRKRFTDALDAPQFSQGEWLFTARSICDALNMLPFDHARHLQSDYATQLYDSFTPKQAEDFWNGERLYTRDFSPAQQKVAYSWIGNAVFADTYRVWQSVVELLRGLPHSRLIREEHKINVPEGSNSSDALDSQGSNYYITGSGKAGMTLVSTLSYLDPDARQKRRIAIQFAPLAERKEVKP